MGSPIPFELVSEDAPLILLELRVNGDGPFRFLFDTGASHTVLGKPLADRLGLEPTEFEKGKGAFEPIDAGKVRLRSVIAGDAEVEDVDAVVMDLSGMQEAIPQPFDGILGYTFFKAFRVTVDYRTCRLGFE